MSVNCHQGMYMLSHDWIEKSAPSVTNKAFPLYKEMNIKIIEVPCN